MEKTISPQIQQTINYHTNRLSQVFRLQPADRDDVRQELTLTALEAIKNYTVDVNASLLTYVKAALQCGAAGVIRKIKNAPPTANARNMSYLEEMLADYRRQTNSGMPLTISMNTDIERLSVSSRERDIELKLDIEAILRTFSWRQKSICRMLMDGYTLQEIADKFHVTKQRIHRIIRQILKILQNNSTGPLTEFPFLQLSTYREPPKAI